MKRIAKVVSILHVFKNAFPGDWSAAVPPGDPCDQGREGAQAGDGHQR